MSEQPAMTQDEIASQAVPASTQIQSAGQMLRAAREASGLHIAALAVSMKVPVKKLEALEADRLDLLPDAVFVRALAASVCRTLKIESTDILSRLPQTLVPRLDADTRSINTPFHSAGHAPVWTASSLLKNPVFLVVLLLLAGALLVVFFPETPSATESTTTQSPVAVLPVLEEKAIAVAVDTPAQPTSVPSAPNMGIGSTSGGVEVTSASAVPARAISAAVAAVATEPLRPSTGVVSFKQRGPSWVEVTDSNGVVQLRKILALGESISVSGELPLTVVVGRADVTDVEVRGKPFGLLEIAKDNVARFEVK